MIYIGIISIFCAVILYYFYRSSSDLSRDTKLPDSVESPNYPSFTRSEGDVKQKNQMLTDHQDAEMNQGESEEKSDEESITNEKLDEEDLEAFFDGWDIQKNSLGDITSVTSSSRDKNLPLPTDEDSQSGNVLLWAQKVAPMFGGSGSQINSSQITGTSLMKHYFLKQVIDGYEVYGGGLQVSVNQDDQGVFNVNNSLKEINIENFNSNLNYSQEQAWQRVRNEFSSSVTQINAERYGAPQFFVRGSVQELAWVFDVRLSSITGRPDVRRVVVGGISGNILENLSTIVH